MATKGLQKGYKRTLKKNKGAETVPDQECSMNYENSSKAMEADSALDLVTQIYDDYKSSVYVGRICSDDDSSMRAMLKHASNNKSGKLRDDIPEPSWLADPTHRCKCVAKGIYALATKAKASSHVTKCDAMRIKKYYSYFIKKNRDKSFDEMKKRCYAPLEHLFDNHEHCDATWCHKKRAQVVQDSGITNSGNSNRDKPGYY